MSSSIRSTIAQMPARRYQLHHGAFGGFMEDQAGDHDLIVRLVEEQLAEALDKRAAAAKGRD